MTFHETPSAEIRNVPCGQRETDGRGNKTNQTDAFRNCPAKVFNKRLELSVR